MSYEGGFGWDVFVFFFSPSNKIWNDEENQKIGRILVAV